MGSSISALLIISVLLTSVIVMFRSNQIGMNLLAEANRTAAEYRAEKLDSAFELTSEVSTLASYNEVDALGCKPLFTGIPRQGEVTGTDPYQCYWFDAPAGLNFQINYVRDFLTEMGRSASNRLSLDYYGVGENVTATNFGSEYIDSLSRFGSLDVTSLTNSTDTNKHHLKVWSYASNGDYHGKYSVDITHGVAVNLSDFQCVDKFRLKNVGQTSFPVGSMYFSEKIDIFIQLRPANQPETFLKLNKSLNATPGNDEWSFVLPATITENGIQQSNDQYEPSILNNNETMQISIKLNNYNKEPGTLIVIWPNGLKTTENFDSLCNN